VLADAHGGPGAGRSTQLATGQVPLAWLCKGFEPGAAGGTGLMVARNPEPGRLLDVLGGVLSGPSFALEVARGDPTALVAGSRTPARCGGAGDGCPWSGTARLRR